MADTARDQALITTFAFGSVVCAALGTVLFRLLGGASSLFRGGLRLALAGFLLFVTLWAFDGFIGTFVSETSPTGCHVVVALASAFDQIARTTLEEYLFWAMKPPFRATPGVWLSQIIIFLRFILGGIFIGLQRPQFAPTCVARNLLWQIGVAIAATDTLIVIMLLTRASYVGILRDVKATGPVGFRAKGLTWTTIALGLWIPLSVPMLIGLASLGLAIRNTLPSIGALLVIVCIAFFYKGLIWSEPVTDQSPVSYANHFPGLDAAALPVSRGIERQDMSTIDSARYAPESSRVGQGSTGTRSNTGERSAPYQDGRGALSTISRPGPSQAAFGFGGVPIKGQLFPPLRANPALGKQRRDASQAIKKATISGGKLVISRPIVESEGSIEPSPLKRSATVDPTTAYIQYKQRQNNVSQLKYSVSSPSTQSAKNHERIGRQAVATPSWVGKGSRQKLEPVVERSSLSASSPVSNRRSTNDAGFRQWSPRHIIQLVDAYLLASVPASLGVQLRGASADQSPSQTTDSLITLPMSPVRTSAADLHPVPNQVEQLKTEIDLLVPPVPPLSPVDKDVQPLYTAEDDSDAAYQDARAVSGIPHTFSGASLKNIVILLTSTPQTTPLFEEEADPLQAPMQLREIADVRTGFRAQAEFQAEEEMQTPTMLFGNGLDCGDAGASNLEQPRPGWIEDADRDSVLDRPGPIPRRSPPMSPPKGLSPAYLESPALSTPLSSKEEDVGQNSSPILPGADSTESTAPASARARAFHAASQTYVLEKPAIDLQEISSELILERFDFPLFPGDLSIGSTDDESAFLDADDDVRQTVAVMLDCLAESPAKRTSTPPSDRVYGGSSGKSGSWHRRIGDDCPTFSDRNAGQSRRVAKPPPLSLEKITERIKSPAPQISSLETPQHALDMIVEQLEKIDGSNFNIDDIEVDGPRMTTLADIEAEMDLQETRWQELRADLPQGSSPSLASSTLSSVPVTEHSPAESRVSPLSGISANNGATTTDNSSGKQEDNGNLRSLMILPAHQVENSRADAEKLVMLNTEGTTLNSLGESAPPSSEEVVVAKQSSSLIEMPMSFVDAGTRTTTHMGAKGPQDIGSEEQRHDDGDAWQTAISDNGPVRAIGPKEILGDSTSEFDMQPVHPRTPASWPESRRSSEPAAPVTDGKKSDGDGKTAATSQPQSPWLRKAKLDLFGFPESPKTARSKPPARPLIVKPPRRSRRISSLPDIVEDPVPMQNKRRTLGIYQFPWGEVSDTATLPALSAWPWPSRPLMGMPSHMPPAAAPSFPSLALQMKMMQLQHLQASLFNDYGGQGITGYASDNHRDKSFYDDDDDSFDEPIIWEMAGFPPEDKIPLTQGGEVMDEPSSISPVTRRHLERQTSSPTLGRSEVSLWVNHAPSSPTRRSNGISQDDDSWAVYVNEASRGARAPTRKHPPMAISSTSMWSLPARRGTSACTSLLWSSSGKVDGMETSFLGGNGIDGQPKEEAGFASLRRSDRDGFVHAYNEVDSKSCP